MFERFILDALSASDHDSEFWSFEHSPTRMFTDKNAARRIWEASRWSNGVYCPHCGGTEKNKRLEGKSHRPSLYQCGDCRQQFTVTVGTVFERSKVPLNKWLLATFLMASSKKGISAHQWHRTIGVTYKTCIMFHRIREAMRNDSNVDFGVGRHGRSGRNVFRQRKGQRGPPWLRPQAQDTGAG